MADEVDLHELDRLLRNELAVEPSVDFIPRVRARLELERGPAGLADRSWMPGWLQLSGWRLVAAVATLIVAAGAFLLLRAPDTRSPIGRTEVATSEPAPLISPRTLPAPPAPASTAAVARPPDVHRKPAVPARLPAVVAAVEVIVDKSQRAAISRVLEMVNDGRLTEASFVASRPLEMPVLDEVTTRPLVVEPVAVSPVTAGGVLQKEIERN